ncbi:MAG: hypothetical protein AAF492_25845, partial [Verrucomicrobiota bacterium]
GGGIAVSSGGNLTTQVRFEHLLVSNNITQGSGDGAGIFIGSESGNPGVVGVDFYMSDSIIRNNNSADNGGGMEFKDGVNVIERCFFFQNECEDQGGAIRIDSTSAQSGTWSWDIINTTISDNDARTDDGGGIYVAFGGVVRLDHCTVVNNTVSSGATRFGGGLWEHDGDLSIHNTILLGNTDSGTGTASDDGGGQDGDMSSEDHNLTGVGTVTFFGGAKGNDTTAASLAAAGVTATPGLNGAPNGIWTHAISAAIPGETGGTGGSASGGALRTDNSTVDPVDARGLARAQGAQRGDNTTDKGAYEFNTTGPHLEPAGAMPPMLPEIQIERPAATIIVDGGADNLGNQTPGTIMLNYVIRNTGSGALIVSNVTFSGAVNANTFSHGAPLTVAPGTASNLLVQFNIGGGPFSFNMDFLNNDADENPYDIAVGG